MRAIWIAASLLCAGCGAGDADTTAAGGENDAAPAPSPAAGAAQAAERRIEEKDGLVEFTYAWPASAAAIPKLDARLEAEMQASLEEARAAAKEDKDGRPPELPFNGHYFEKIWTAYGQSDRLLTLGASNETFTGGAHGNIAFDGVLWDRREDRAIGFGDLFADAPGALAALTPAYCTALDRERSTRREEPLPLEGDDWMTGCPALAEQVVVPADEDGDGRFETLNILIPPYEAGPYAEGAYPIEIAMSDEAIRRIKPDYSGSFEAGAAAAAAGNAQPQ